MFDGRILDFWIAIQVVGWITQFIGHGVFEKRAPALLTNLFYIWLSPFFVVFEYLNIIFGYRQEDKDVYDQIVLADIAHYRKQANLPPLKVD